MTFAKDKTQAKNYLAVIHELANYVSGSKHWSYFRMLVYFLRTIRNLELRF